MNQDDYTIDTVTVNTVGDISLSYDYDNIAYNTVTIDASTFTTDTIDLSGILSSDEKRLGLRDSGEIPIDIWAKLYNNGIVDD